ncbi:hypothetical protein chiPu_0017667 [Chiloscyllium punctatum]|uniref:Uncharacterized protein n=1 Tax=Chiloscyllium punctatum TaxID=137246 RepID=A0A401RHW5_CHIPU|nr:hypothetical protein [Chiloscyllium punctatum]
MIAPCGIVSHSREEAEHNAWYMQQAARENKDIFAALVQSSLEGETAEVGSHIRAAVLHQSNAEATMQFAGLPSVWCRRAVDSGIRSWSLRSYHFGLVAPYKSAKHQAREK